MADPLTVSLPRFEGPLDLLLSLVRKNEVAITDIPIAEITRQYLDYVRQAEQLDIDLGGEFTFMAATLIWIKARTLLPRDPADGASEPDLRQELINQLLVYEEVRAKAVDFLADKLRDSQNSWSNSTSQEFCEPAPVEQAPALVNTLNVFDVIRLAEQVLEIARAHSRLDLSREEVTVEGMVRWVEDLLNNIHPGEILESTRLFNQQVGVNRKITLFLALLEMARVDKLRLRQEFPFGKISVMRPVGAQTVSVAPAIDGRQ